MKLSSQYYEGLPYIGGPIDREIGNANNSLSFYFPLALLTNNQHHAFFPGRV